MDSSHQISTSTGVIVLLDEQLPPFTEVPVLIRDATGEVIHIHQLTVLNLRMQGPPPSIRWDAFGMSSSRDFTPPVIT